VLQIGLGFLVATSTANIVAVPRTFPAIVMSASDTGGYCFRQSLKTCADIVELVDFVKDRFKTHGYTALSMRA
jgi:hypothetical protein